MLWKLNTFLRSQFNLSQINNDFTVKVNTIPYLLVLNRKVCKSHKYPLILQWMCTMHWLNPIFFKITVVLYGVISNKLQKMQNRAARILTFSNYEVCLSVFLDELGWKMLDNAPTPRTESAKGSLHYRRDLLWNKTPLENTNLSSINYLKNFISWERLF